MITNTRLLELRATALACQRMVDQGVATHLEKEYAALYQLLQDENVLLSGKRNVADNNGPHLDLLLGR